MVKYLELKNLNLVAGADKFDQSLIGTKILKLRTLTFLQGENCYFINYCDAIKGIAKIMAWIEIEKLPKPFPVDETEELALLDTFFPIEDRYLCIAMLYSKKKDFNIQKDLKSKKLKNIAKEMHDSIDQIHPLKDIIQPKVMTIAFVDGELVLK
jgi:hypothetical protein